MNAGFLPGGTPQEYTHDTTINSINISEIGAGDKNNFPMPVSDMLSRNPYLNNTRPEKDGIIQFGSIDMNS